MRKKLEETVAEIHHRLEMRRLDPETPASRNRELVEGVCAAVKADPFGYRVRLDSHLWQRGEIITRIDGALALRIYSHSVRKMREFKLAAVAATGRSIAWANNWADGPEIRCRIEFADEGGRAAVIAGGWLS